jgi:5-formyltetrahydrofolate cyclo-ligase
MDNPELKAAKQELRRTIRLLKLQQTAENKILQSNIIMAKIERMEAFAQAKSIMLYWSMPDEVITHDFILKWASTKEILLPSVQGNELALREFKSMDDLKPGQAFGIMEPCGQDFCDYQSIDIIIVPGVAFDLKNRRLGRGKAYYDKFLNLTNALKIGICFDFQLVDEVPAGMHDLAMDMVISASY